MSCSSCRRITSFLILSLLEISSMLLNHFIFADKTLLLSSFPKDRHSDLFIQILFIYLFDSITSCWLFTARWMNEWINVHDYSDTITANCCRDTVQMLWVGSLEKCCFQLLTEAGQWQRRPDTSWQGVPGTCGRHWKCPVVECGSASWRHDFDLIW